MDMNEFSSFYREREKDLYKECMEMVKNGECDEDWAMFRFYMVRDEVLAQMIDEEEFCGGGCEQR